MVRKSGKNQENYKKTGKIGTSTYLVSIDTTFAPENSIKNE